MDVDSVRAQCERRLADIPIPHPFELTTFCAELAEMRERPIRLLAQPLAGVGLTGMWICGDQCDYVLYEQHTSPVHQDHIALHEIGHVLCAHQSARALDGDTLAPHVFSLLDPSMVRRVLGRAGYSSQEEYEAELLASMIMQRATRPSAPRIPNDKEQVLRRLEEIL